MMHPQTVTPSLTRIRRLTRIPLLTTGQRHAPLLVIAVTASALLSPALAALLLVIAVAVLIRPASEAGRSLLSLTLAAGTFLTAALTVQSTPGGCTGVFALSGVLYMALSTWTSLRR